MSVIPAQPVSTLSDSVIAARPDGRGAIEAFVQINGIAERNLPRIDLIGPDLEIGEPGLAIDRGESAVHGIQTVGELDAADARDVVAGVEDTRFQLERPKVPVPRAEPDAIMGNSAVMHTMYKQIGRLAGGDQSKAAKWLGVSRPTMREKLLRYGLHPRVETIAEIAA